MFLHITDVHYVKDYILQLTFNNGAIKQVNLCNELDGDIFEPLKEKSIFQQVQVNAETKTIEWPNGADFAPEFLYEIGQLIQQKSAEQETSSSSLQPVPA